MRNTNEKEIRVLDVCGQLLQLLFTAVLHAGRGQYWHHKAQEFGLERQI